MSEHPDLSALVSALGCEPAKGLLEQALTHRSHSYEHGGIPHNERLEFLGDSVLGLAVTSKLFEDHPEFDEGELARHRAALVSTVALAEIARGIGLGEFVRLGRGEELTGGRNKDSILADTVEALIGATYLSAGADTATALVHRLIAPLEQDVNRFGAATDPKTYLQELAARLSKSVSYQVESEGPDHAKEFTAAVFVGGEQIATGTGSSKKHAEMAAALVAWNTLSE